MRPSIQKRRKHVCYAANSNPAEWTEAQDRKLGRYLRHKTAHTNNVVKCRKAVEDYRKARSA